jgi:hypothetical protein
MTPIGQPTLPAESTYSDAELLFIQESPENLWPSNQDSNFGQIRKILTDELQTAVDQINSMFNDAFIDTAGTRIASWEVEYGLPIGAAKALNQRRTDIKARIKKSPFTRTRRIEIVEDYIRVTQGGAPIQLVPEGVTIGSGLTLWGENVADITSLYTITESITGFSYAVSISGSVTPDIAGLTRELSRITPANISFTVTNP